MALDVRRLRSALCATLLLLASTAQADGAFPDSLQILLPPDHPERIFLSTNFGLVLTTDGARSFRLVCEAAISKAIPYLYQLGQAPAETLFAVDGQGLHWSGDVGCSWTAATGSVSGLYMQDVFPDPVDPGRVLALGFDVVDGGAAISAVFESRDGGRSFAPPLYRAPPELALTGVEIPRSAPDGVYLTLVGERETLPTVARSTDRGAHFTASDLTPSLGPMSLRLAAVDAQNGLRLYLRGTHGNLDVLVISDDGGRTARVALDLHDVMTAFLALDDGSLLVGSAKGGGYRSTDGGQTFAPWFGALHLRALAARGGHLYAAADNYKDGFVLGVSDDAGAHFTPLLRWPDLCGPAQCGDVPAACETGWEVLLATLNFTPSPSCRPAAMNENAPTPSSSGCGCVLGDGRDAGPRSLVLLGLVAVMAAAGRARGRRRRGDQSPR